jgi:hypothetical protein
LIDLLLCPEQFRSQSLLKLCVALQKARRHLDPIFLSGDGRCTSDGGGFSLISPFQINAEKDFWGRAEQKLMQVFAKPHDQFGDCFQKGNIRTQCFVGVIDTRRWVKAHRVMDPAIKFDPGSPKVQALRQSMFVAYEEFQKAHVAYEHALSVTGNSPNSADIIALQQAGRDYAGAVAKHSQVVMAWLAMVDRSR